MSKEREALKLALEALKYRGSNSWRKRQPAIIAIEEALAQPEQEPVAVVVQVQHPAAVALKLKADVPVGATLYTTPPQRTWVGLTDEDVDEMWERTGDYDSFANAIEAKLKEKNT